MIRNKKQYIPNAAKCKIVHITGITSKNSGKGTFKSQNPLNTCICKELSNTKVVECLYNDACGIDGLKDEKSLDRSKGLATTIENTQSESQSHTIEELNNQLDTICKNTNTNRSGLDVLISYYQKSFSLTEETSLRYAIDLFKNGTIDQIKVFGKDGEVL